jgi:hypothetical protein
MENLADKWIYDLNQHSMPVYWVDPYLNRKVYHQLMQKTVLWNMLDKQGKAL